MLMLPVSIRFCCIRFACLYMFVSKTIGANSKHKLFNSPCIQTILQICHIPQYCTLLNSQMLGGIMCCLLYVHPAYLIQTIHQIYHTTQYIAPS